MRKILLLIAIAGFVEVNSQDRVFTYTYQSGVLNKAQKEIEVGSTLATGRENYYRGVEHRVEFEVGLGHALQTAFYLNYGYAKSVVVENNTQSLHSDADYSFSNEWKLKLTDPIANRIGSALYLELTLSPTDAELEGKAIFDKQTGRFLNAFNVVAEYVTEKQFALHGTKMEAENMTNTNIEFNYGLSYKVRDNLRIGLEAFLQNGITQSKWEHSVLLLGPGLSYSMDGFWANLTCMPQITDWRTGRLDLDEHERLQARLLFSYAF